jgi:hypothetical protein
MKGRTSEFVDSTVNQGKRLGQKWSDFGERTADTWSGNPEMKPSVGTTNRNVNQTNNNNVNIQNVEVKVDPSKDTQQEAKKFINGVKDANMQKQIQQTRVLVGG